jgi:hypothetical protein
MGAPCISSVLMGVLTVGFIIADYYFNYGERVISYIFLGSITTILFYQLCSYGYQTINWAFLAIIPIYVIFALVSIYLRDPNLSDASDMCDSCEMEYEYECKMPKPKTKSCAPKKPKCK